MSTGDEPDRNSWMTEPDEVQAEVPSEASPGEEECVPSAECWRCRLPVPIVLAECPRCHANLVREVTPIPSDAHGAKDVVQVIVGFTLLLLLSLGVGVIARLQPEQEVLVALDGIGAVLMAIVVMVCLRRVPATPQDLIHPGLASQLCAWVASPLILAALLAVNFAQAQFLRDLIGIKHDWILDRQGQYFLWFLVTYTIPPAIFEELFFRRLAIDVFARHIDRHSAILIAGVMFGMAHIGQPLGIPYLCLFGVVLGYIRLATGSLYLPMLLHALHNGFVICKEDWINAW